MNTASLKINMPGTGICNIYLKVDTDGKTKNTFSIQYIDFGSDAFFRFIGIKKK